MKNLWNNISLWAADILGQQQRVDIYESLPATVSIATESILEIPADLGHLSVMGESTVLTPSAGSTGKIPENKVKAECK